MGHLGRVERQHAHEFSFRKLIKTLETQVILGQS